MTPKFSIITCTYNSEDYLQDNINSVASQTFTNFEHIFIDGNSTDNTINIIKQYQKKFPERKIKLFQTPPKGISNAMNVGIDKSSGKYLIHLHSDDNFYNNNVLSDVNTFINQKNNPDWIYGKINVIEKNGLSIGKFPKYPILHYNYKNIIGKHLLKYFSFIPHQAVFIKRNVFTNYKNFDESLKSSMDIDLWLRIVKNTRWFFFNRTISNYRIHETAQSSGVKNKEENQINFEIVQKRYLNRMELILSKIINKLISILNKTKR